jgi:hypothetical protein
VTVSHGIIIVCIIVAEIDAARLVIVACMGDGWIGFTSLIVVIISGLESIVNIFCLIDIAI